MLKIKKQMLKYVKSNTSSEKKFWGIFDISSPQSKFWGDTSPSSPQGFTPLVVAHSLVADS